MCGPDYRPQYIFHEDERQQQLAQRRKRAKARRAAKLQAAAALARKRSAAAKKAARTRRANKAVAGLTDALTKATPVSPILIKGKKSYRSLPKPEARNKQTNG